MKDKIKITGLMACDPTGVVGDGDHLPWHYPEDTAFFRQTVDQQIMILGRKTYEAMPESTLAKSECIVFSSDSAKISSPNVTFVASLEQFLNLNFLSTTKKIYMVGGGVLAKLFLEHHLIDDFLLTEIAKHYPGDVFFPRELIAHWPKTLVLEKPEFSIYHYVNPNRRAD